MRHAPRSTGCLKERLWSLAGRAQGVEPEGHLSLSYDRNLGTWTAR